MSIAAQCQGYAVKILTTTREPPGESLINPRVAYDLRGRGNNNDCTSLLLLSFSLGSRDFRDGPFEKSSRRVDLSLRGNIPSVALSLSAPALNIDEISNNVAEVSKRKRERERARAELSQDEYQLVVLSLYADTRGYREALNCKRATLRRVLFAAAKSLLPQRATFYLRLV